MVVYAEEAVVLEEWRREGDGATAFASLSGISGGGGGGGGGGTNQA